MYLKIDGAGSHSSVCRSIMADDEWNSFFPLEKVVANRILSCKWISHTHHSNLVTLRASPYELICTFPTFHHHHREGAVLPGSVLLWLQIIPSDKKPSCWWTPPNSLIPHHLRHYTWVHSSLTNPHVHWQIEYGLVFNVPKTSYRKIAPFNLSSFNLGIVSLATRV